MSSRPAGPAAVSPTEVFVGRERELDELRAGWRDALAGRGRLFLIHGEAGIGKTRLAETIANEAFVAGAQVAWGRCWEDGGAPALWPWIQIVRSLTRDLDAERLTQYCGRGADYLVQLVPEVAHLLPTSTPAIPNHSSTPSAQFPMFDALVGFLAQASAERPLVLILDDLHAADEPSLLALDFLARELPTRRLLLLGTYREVEAQRVGDRMSLLHRIARQGHRLPLSGLSEVDSARLIEQSFVRAPAAGVVHALHRTTEGNPFFLDEVVRLLIAMPDCAGLDHIPSTGLPLPLAVRDAIRQRLRPLSVECQHTLGRASVIGRQFSFACLRATGDTSDTTLLDQLEEAVASVLLTPPPQPYGDYRFQHALIRETLYDDLSASERLQLHAQVGQVMLTLHQGDLEAHIAEIAHHFLQSAVPGKEQRAIELALRAARRAEALAAFEDAAHWYERAHALLPPQANDSRQNIELLLAKGEAQSKAWNTDSAQDTFRTAARLARTAAAHGEYGAAMLFAQATLGLGGTGIGMPRGTFNPELAELLEDAADLLAGGDYPALEARVLGRLALELYFSQVSERRHALMHTARRLAHDSGDRAAQAYVANVRLVTDWDTPDPRRRLADADEALAAADAAADHDLEFRARVFRIMDLIELGDFAAGQQELERYAERVASHRRPAYESTVATLRVMNALWLGQFAEAETMCLAQLANAERWEDPHARVSTHLQILALRLARGGAEELEPFIHAAATQANVAAEVRAGFAVLLHAIGKARDARALYETLAAQDFADLARERHLQSILAWLVELACAYGTAPQQRALLGYLEPQAGTFLSFVARLCFGPSEFFLARLEHALGQHDAATRHFEIALQHCARTGGRPALARTQLAYARCEAEFDGGIEAASGVHQLLDLAEQGAVELGMQPLLVEIESLRQHLQAPQANVVQLDELEVPARRVANGGRGQSRVVPFARPTPTPTPKNGPIEVARPAPAAASLFRSEDGLWTISHQGTVLRLQKSKGLRYLAELLRQPGREMHVMDLAALEQPSPGPSGSEFAHLGSSSAGRAGVSVGRGDAGLEVLDTKARAAYRQRLHDVRDELREASEFNDRGRMTRLQHELEALTNELASSLGLGGRDRTRASLVERTRLNVTRALQTAIKRIGEGHSGLGHHFAQAVRTGTLCCYEPRPEHKIPWQL